MLEINNTNMMDQYEMKTQNNTDYIESKLQFFENMIEQITYEQAELSSQVGSAAISANLLDRKAQELLNRKLTHNMMSVGKIEMQQSKI